MTFKGTLAVRNEPQKILFDEELSGQISDGMWENTVPHNHWEVWCDAEVIVDPRNVGRDFYAVRDNYNFVNRELISIVGDRMLQAVQTRFPHYTREDMMDDLRELKQIVRTRRAS